MKPEHDAYGEMLLAALDGQRVAEIVERDDGFIEANQSGPLLYLAPFRRWPVLHRQAMRHVRGRVLDVGCGGGRVCLHLQERGLDVVGIDVSPGAVEACRRRGVRDVRLCPIEEMDESLGRFDTVVMLGNNFGLLSSRSKGKRLLRRLCSLTCDRGRIVAESRDVYQTDDPAHLAYHEHNRRRGRMAGQVRIRVRYRTHATPWFDYLMVSTAEMAELLAGTGWTLTQTFESAGTYIAIIDRE